MNISFVPVETPEQIARLAALAREIWTEHFTSIIGAFNIFEPVQLISEGGPDGTTKVILYQIYNEAFQNGNYGMGSAISVVVLLILMALTMLNMKFGEEKD